MGALLKRKYVVEYIKRVVGLLKFFELCALTSFLCLHMRAGTGAVRQEGRITIYRNGDFL